MRGLSESLAEYGEVMLRAIASQWRVEAGDVAGLPARLAAAMLEPERLRAFLQGLEAEAHAALGQVAAAGGTTRGYLLTRSHGEVRRLGPRAMERERPWERPASPTERLWYAGLVFRRYGRLGAYHGEVYYIPGDLLAALPPLGAPGAAIALTPAGAPSRAWEEDDALALDLEALLARLRLAPIPAPAGKGPFLAPQRTLRTPREREGRTVSTLSTVEGLVGDRWRGPVDPERLALLQRLAVRARLLVQRGGRWQVGAQARAWLQRETWQRQKLLFDTWQGDPQWNELRHVATLRCDDTGWRNDPRAPRAAVLAALRQCPDGWLRLADLRDALKAGDTDFARPDGDYDSWYIRDAQTGQYLQGFAHWDEVEGALIAHLVTRSLFWLGAVALGAEADGAATTAFRLTATGRAFLGQARPPAPLAAAPIALRADLTIAVARTASAYDRVRIERFASWQGREGDADLYRLDAECAWRAFNGGIDLRQIEGFLRRISGRPLPGEMARALRTWHSRFGQVALRRAVLLQTADAETLRLLRGDPELGQRFGAIVSERAVLVPEDQLPQVLARLKALCWWPRLEGLDEPW